MTRFTKALIMLAFIATTSFAADLKHEVWHKELRPFMPGDSVIVPMIDYALIQKLKVGMTFKDVKQVAGFAPLDTYTHPDYAVFETKVDGVYYEVAFLHKKSHKVEAISYQKQW
jgi:hypothetical protein